MLWYWHIVHGSNTVEWKDENEYCLRHNSIILPMMIKCALCLCAALGDRNPVMGTEKKTYFERKEFLYERWTPIKLIHMMRYVNNKIEEEWGQNAYKNCAIKIFLFVFHHLGDWMRPFFIKTWISICFLYFFFAAVVIQSSNFRRNSYTKVTWCDYNLFRSNESYWINSSWFHVTYMTQNIFIFVHKM